MTTAQTTDSQTVQGTSPPQENTFDTLMSNGSSMLKVAAAFIGMMGAGESMKGLLQKLVEQGMALYTQGESYLMCDSWSSMEQLNVQYRKDGTNTVMDNTMNADLDPNGIVTDYVNGAIFEGADYAKFPISSGDAPTKQLGQDFVTGVKTYVSEESATLEENLEDFATSDSGETAYSSAYYSAQIEENAGEQMLQFVQQLLGTFSSESSALMNIADTGSNFNRSNSE